MIARSATGAAMGAVAPIARRVGRRIKKRMFKRWKQRARYQKARKSARRRRQGGRKKGVSKKGLTSHSGLKRLYNHDSLSLCVGQSTKMLNTTKTVADAEEEIVDHISDYATETITNNGTNPDAIINGSYIEADGTVKSAVYFGNDDLTTYNSVDYLKQVGLHQYTLTTPEPFASPSPNDIIHQTSNQIFNMRSMFKKWRKDSISFRIKWRTMINSTHPLGIPKGYYRLFHASQERVSYTAPGVEYVQGTNPADITHYERQFFSPAQTLARKYGAPTPRLNKITGTLNESGGAFFNGTKTAPAGDKYYFDSSTEYFHPKIGQQTFCYRNIRENPKGWRKIPPGGTMEIIYNYPKLLHPTQENDIALDPILMFVFENTDAWQPTKQDITLEQTGSSFSGEAVPHQDKDIIPAIIADIETLHAFFFSKRATLNTPPIVIPSPAVLHPY